jgi:dienelactone hydrolase
MSALERIEYRDAGTPLTGWLARPAGRPRAAVVVFPTIANVTPPIERRAAMLAEAGYLAMIADFYGEPVDSFEASGPLAERLRADVNTYRTRLAAAVAALRSHRDAAGLQMAAIGYCMGGQAALEAARSGADLTGAVSFHGLLDTARPATAGAIKARILVCHGDADPMVPRRKVVAFWEEMDAAGADWHFHSYSGVKHGFTDPGSDARGLAAIAYDASADRQSWNAMIEFFGEIFGA